MKSTVPQGVDDLKRTRSIFRLMQELDWHFSWTALKGPAALRMMGFSGTTSWNICLWIRVYRLHSQFWGSARPWSLDSALNGAPGCSSLQFCTGLTSSFESKDLEIRSRPGQSLILSFLTDASITQPTYFQDESNCCANLLQAICSSQACSHLQPLAVLWPGVCST